MNTPSDCLVVSRGRFTIFEMFPFTGLITEPLDVSLLKCMAWVFNLPLFISKRKKDLDVTKTNAFLTYWLWAVRSPRHVPSMVIETAQEEQQKKLLAWLSRKLCPLSTLSKADVSVDVMCSVLSKVALPCKLLLVLFSVITGQGRRVMF